MSSLETLDDRLGQFRLHVRIVDGQNVVVALSLLFRNLVHLGGRGQSLLQVVDVRTADAVTLEE